MRCKEGDIVVDKTYTRTVKALVLWTGFTPLQPLLTPVDEYAPYWATYEGISEVVGHVYLADTIIKLSKEGAKK